MIFRSYNPCFLLEPYIKVIHLRHFVFPQQVSVPCKPYPPRPEHCMAFYVRGSETTEHPFEGITYKKPRSVLSGQYTKQINRYSSHEFLMILVVFKPGALYHFTRLSFEQLMNTALDAEAVFGSAITRLNERLSSTDNYSEMLRLINDFFCRLINVIKVDEQPIDTALDSILKNQMPVTVQQLASDCCLSMRQLERKLLDRVGVGPKTFLKIVRFNQSYTMRLRHPHVSWQAIASTCGYTDYQHLVKDYRTFTGTSAVQFFKMEEKAPERVLGLNR